MKKLWLFLCAISLCGCQSSNIHVCKMTDGNYKWEVEYHTNDANEVVSMKQTVEIQADDAKELEESLVALDEIFEEYVESYKEACHLEKTQQELVAKRVLSVDASKLTFKQREMMSLEKDAEYIIMQLEYAGYTCK